MLKGRRLAHVRGDAHRPLTRERFADLPFFCQTPKDVLFANDGNSIPLIKCALREPKANTPTEKKKKENKQKKAKKRRERKEANNMQTHNNSH